MEKIKEIQRTVLQQTKQLNAQSALSKPSMSPPAYEEEMRAMDALLRAAEESAKYWETQYYSKNPGSIDSKSLEKARAAMQKQYISEIEKHKATIKRLQVA